MIEITRTDDGLFIGGQSLKVQSLSRYRDKTIIRAVRMTEPFKVLGYHGTYFEGDAGDWLLVNPDGSAMPCPDATFRMFYELA